MAPRRISPRRPGLLPVLLLAVFSAAPAAAHNGKVAVAFPMAPVVVDGDLSDWPDGLEEHVLTPRSPRTPPLASDLTVTLRLGVDPAQAVLYGAVRVTDESVVLRTGTPEELAQRQWGQQDGLEIYAGAGHDEHGLTAQLGLRGSHRIRGRGWESLEVSGAHDEGGYAYEFAIDLTGFGLSAPLSEDVVIPFDLAVVDRDADGSFTWASWGPHPGKSGDATRVGDVLLGLSQGVTRGGLGALGRASEVGALETWRRERSRNALNFFLIGVVIVAALLHFLLFAFHPTSRPHLYYALFATLLAVTIAYWVFSWEISRWLPVPFVLIAAVLIAAVCLAWLRFLYSLFSDRLPRRFWVLTGLVALGVVLQVVLLSALPDFLSILGVNVLALAVVLLASLESVRVSVAGLRRRQAGARIVFLAYAPVVLLVVIGVVLPNPFVALGNIAVGAVWLVVAMAAHLALDVGRAQRRLEELTARTLAQNRQIEEATRNKSEFLRRMSHDLRSPMNAIIGYTRLLRRRLADRLDEREARNLANIQTSSNNLLNLINDILDLSRIEAGRVDVHMQSVDVRQLADECADALESIVAEGVVLRRELDDVGSIRSDPDRLRQILMNLLGNATKFTHEGSITLALRRKDDVVELSVVDTGIGIPADDLPHVFDEFRQVERQGGEQSEGTGLGLAIARKTAELLGGTITATSEVGRGTTFTVALPAG